MKHQPTITPTKKQMQPINCTACNGYSIITFKDQLLRNGKPNEVKALYGAEIQFYYSYFTANQQSL